MKPQGLDGSELSMRSGSLSASEGENVRIFELNPNKTSLSGSFGFYRNVFCNSEVNTYVSVIHKALKSTVRQWIISYSVNFKNMLKSPI